MIPRLLEPKKTYTFDYPYAVELADEQCSIFWTHNEIELSKDIQDILVNMTEAERHGVITVLKLFTKYELEVGNEYWGGVIANWFQRPDIQRMASAFSFFELNVHAPFYNKINQLLHLDTDEFYNSYTEDETLNDRVQFIDNALKDPDKAYCLAIFAIIEGAILYSNFAYLKHFQSQGKNKLKNLVAGIDFSVRDENIHHLGGVFLFRTLLNELNLTLEQERDLFARVYAAADIIRSHEHRIVDMIFEKGRVEGITAHQLKNFVDSRIDLCLQNLGMVAKYEPASNPIGEWFYLGISQTRLHDFFAQQGNQYHRDWKEEGFVWSMES